MLDQSKVSDKGRCLTSLHLERGYNTVHKRSLHRYFQRCQNEERRLWKVAQVDEQPYIIQVYEDEEGIDLQQTWCHPQNSYASRSTVYRHTDIQDQDIKRTLCPWFGTRPWSAHPKPTKSKTSSLQLQILWSNHLNRSVHGVWVEK